MEKGIWLTVIKFIAAIIIAICTLCTDCEVPMESLNNTTKQVETIMVESTVDHPSS